MEECKNCRSEIHKSKDHPNTVSITLHSLLETQVNMMRTFEIVSEKDYYLDPLSRTKSESISKKLHQIKDYLEKEMENISDLIFSLSDSIISENFEENGMSQDKSAPKI